MTKDLLFVYGTLMDDIESNIARHLRQHADFLGTCQVQGRLYDLGLYPALVLASENQYVSGHLYRMHQPFALLLTLDDYEGIIPGKESEALYKRQLVEINNDTQKDFAWVYVYNQSTENLKLIPFNNYLDYLKINDAHQQFIRNA